MLTSARSLGVPDTHIILMLADDAACNPRNPQRPSMFYHPNHMLELYDDDVQVDYRGQAVTVAALLELLTGRCACSDMSPPHTQHA